MFNLERNEEQTMTAIRGLLDGATEVEYEPEVRLPTQRRGASVLVGAVAPLAGLGSLG